MANGAATITKIEVFKGWIDIYFEIRSGGITDRQTVTFQPENPAENLLASQDITGLKYLVLHKVGDTFPVTVEVFPPQTSASTHLGITAFNGPARRKRHPRKVVQTTLRHGVPGCPPSPKSRR